MEGEVNAEYTSLWEKVNDGNTLLVDTRLVNEYTKGHVPGSVCAPYSRTGWGRSLATYLGGSAEELVILAANQAIAGAASREVEQQGIRVSAVISDGIKGWAAAGLPVARMAEITPEELYQDMGSYIVIDVREPFEWRSGVIPGSIRISLNDLPSKMEKLSRNKKYALVCATGSRSQSAAVYMADNGFRAGNVIGGMARWLSKSFPVDYDIME